MESGECQTRSQPLSQGLNLYNSDMMNCEEKKQDKSHPLTFRHFEILSPRKITIAHSGHLVRDSVPLKRRSCPGKLQGVQLDNVFFIGSQVKTCKQD